MLPHATSAQPRHSPKLRRKPVEKPLAFEDVNQQLFSNYNKAKDEIREKLGPLVICSSTELRLLSKGKVQDKVAFIKPHYTGLKQVAHITLGTYVLLINHPDEILGADKIALLEKYKTGIEKASTELKTNEALDSADYERQEQLIKKTLSFLTKAINDKKVSHEELRAFVRDTSVPDLRNAYEAAGSQITTMDDAMTKWHKQMTDEDWKKLHILILTTHMPRNGLLAFQFFCKLLNQTQEGDRIIVAESAGTTTDEQVIDLLLTHILDGKVATDFLMTLGECTETCCQMGRKIG